MGDDIKVCGKCGFPAAFVIDHWPDEFYVCLSHVGDVVIAATAYDIPRAIVTRLEVPR